MRSYEQVRALALAGAKELASYAGGRRRYVTWGFGYTPGSVTASIYHNAVATFTPDGRVEIDTCGHVTPSTFDAISTALGIARIDVGTVKRVPTIMGVGFTRRAVLDTATGEVLEHDEPSQAAPARGVVG